MSHFDPNPNSDPPFDHLVGAQVDRGRHVESERPGGLEVDHQLECAWLQHRQLGRLGAIEYLASVDTRLTPGAGYAGRIADKAAA